MKSISERTAGCKSEAGFLSLHYDPQDGKLFLELAAGLKEFLYCCHLATGLGTVEIMLDRGQTTSFVLREFRRVGPSVLVLEKNLEYRSSDGTGARSVEESFASRVVAVLPVEAEEAGRLLVDATAWLKGDALHLPRRFSAFKLGKIRIDDARCAFELERSRAFPKNTEVEVLVTLQVEGDAPEALDRVLVEGGWATLRQHHSFLQLPEAGYELRSLEPRVGYLSVDFMDYAQPPEQPLTQRLLARWRLEKSDLAAPVSRPRKPIVFHLDQDIPEPYRTAVREGVLWWNEAFQAAGFENAIEVLDLPSDADPMDARISTILWIHRAERGWSVGWSAKDPRTGEILKASVLLDSHRLRTCHEMWMSLVGDDPAREAERRAFTLQRMRLLAAHEVGHALGLCHNFTSSAYDRGSVMDYYAPRIGWLEDRLDLSDAYRQGLGPYDVWAIRFGYGEAAQASAILEEGLRRELHLLADREARALHSPDPRAHQFIDGADPILELRRLREVRSWALGRMGESNLAQGELYYRLQGRFAFVYGLHRFALQATIKNIGGARLGYFRRGDGQVPVMLIEPEQQRAALEEVLECLRPLELEVPRALALLLAPQPLFFEERLDAFSSPAEPLFDPLEPARQLARSILRNLLDERRCARLIGLSRDIFGLTELLGRLTARLWQLPASGGASHHALARLIQGLYVEELFRLAQSSFLEIRRAAELELRTLLGQDPRQASEIERFFKREFRWDGPPKETVLPAGAPIGHREECCWEGERSLYFQS